MRRPRGSLNAPLKVGITLEHSAHQRLTKLAQATGTNRSLVAQWLIETAATDDTGRPIGWPPDPPTLLDHEGDTPKM